MSIKEGDVVKIAYVSCETLTDEYLIMYTPFNSGELWQLKNIKTGEEIALNPLCSNFESLVKVERKS